MSNTFGYAPYTDDNSVVWAKKFRSDVATKMGLTLTKQPGATVWPHRASKCRHSRLKGNTNGNYITIVGVTKDDTFYVSLPGSTITWTDGQTYTKESQIGERKTVAH